MEEFLLCVKLGQLPYYDEIKFKIKRRKKNKNLRNTISRNIKTSGKFEKYLAKIFCDQLPLAFLKIFLIYKNLLNKIIIYLIILKKYFHRFVYGEILQ